MYFHSTRARLHSTHGENIAPRQLLAYLEKHGVHFTPEQQARLLQIATQAGTAPDRLVTKVVGPLSG